MAVISSNHTQPPQQFHLYRSISKQKVLINNSYICIYTRTLQHEKWVITAYEITMSVSAPIYMYNIHINKTSVSTRWCYVYINNTWISSILINCRSLSFSKEWKSFQKTLVVVRSESRKIVWNDSFLPIAGTCKITIPVIKAALPSNCIIGLVYMMTYEIIIKTHLRIRHLWWTLENCMRIEDNRRDYVSSSCYLDIVYIKTDINFWAIWID